MSTYVLTTISLLFFYTSTLPASELSKRPTLIKVVAYQSGHLLHVDIQAEQKAWVELILTSADGKRYEAPRPFKVRRQQENKLTLPIALLSRGTYTLTLYAQNERIHLEKLFIK